MPRGTRRTFGLTRVPVVCTTLALLLATSAAAQTGGQGGGAGAQDFPATSTPGPTPTKIEFTSAVGCYQIASLDSKNVIRSIDELVDEYNHGDLWLQLQADLKAILSTCKFDAPLAQVAPDDFKSKTFLVTFVSNDHQ